jgi:hypothetical protein
MGDKWGFIFVFQVTHDFSCLVLAMKIRSRCICISEEGEGGMYGSSSKCVSSDIRFPPNRKNLKSRLKIAYFGPTENARKNKRKKIPRTHKK